MTSPLGKIVIDGDRAALVFERRVAHPIAVVWAAITEPDQRAVWLGPTAIEPREGEMIDLTAEGPPCTSRDAPGYGTDHGLGPSTRLRARVEAIAHRQDGRAL